MAGGVKRPAARAVRKTKLQRASECGVIPKARRPFQCFVAQKGLQFGAAAKIWKTLSEAEKRPYEEESKGSFSRQREKARAAGVPVRGGAPQSPPTVREPAVATCQGIRIGQDQQYLVGKALGSGTYGTVYNATNCRTGVMVAVKVETRCETIDTEVACLETLRGHPNFLQVEDSHVDLQGLSWMVMPMLRSSLRHLLPVAPDAQMSICLQSLSGLSYMHGKSLVHCDVKPSNIMFCERTRKVHIIDFGLCVKIPARECHACYTPNYRAPELWVNNAKLRGSRLRPASDSWAIGMTLLECSWGKPFFSGDREALISAAIQNFVDMRCSRKSKERARWELALSKVPQQMRQIVADLTEVNVSHRSDCLMTALPSFVFDMTV